MTMKDINEVYKTLIELQNGFRKDLRDVKKPDHDTELILKAKIIAIEQALNELGYEDKS